jgi:hypothetical protein
LREEACRAIFSHFKPLTLNLKLPALLLISFFLFLANLAFGLLVKIGVIDNARLRFVHHGLYFLVIASILTATILSLREGLSHAALPGAMTVLLLLMPFFKGRGRAHWMYATFCAALYSAIVIFS